MTTISRTLFAAAITATCLIGTEAQAQVKDLIRHIPETANAVVLVDAKAIFSSPIAKAGNWQADREANFAAGMTSIPPLADSMVIAADLDTDLMRAKWEVAVAKMGAKNISDVNRKIGDYAKLLGGSVDQVGSVPAVRLVDDTFLLEFADGVLGAMAPGSRQAVGFWITRPNRGLSPYLTEALGDIDTKAHVVMALDLNHAFSADDLQRGMAKFESIKKSQVNPADLAKLMATIKGVQLEISFQDQVYGLLAFDFAEDAAIVSPIAKPLMLDLIGAYGVSIDEVDNWQAQVKGSRVSLLGTFTKSGLLRVSSLIHLPSAALHRIASGSPPPGEAAATGQPADSGKQSEVDLTKKYFASVTMLEQNLRQKKHSMQTLGQLAQWFDSYSGKIGNLPTLGVDPEMLQYGNYVATQLRNCCYALKGNGIQTVVAADNAANNSKVYGGALGNISQNNWQSGGYYGGGGGANYGRRVETNAAYGAAAHFGAEGAMKSGMRQAQQAVTTVVFQSRASRRMDSENDGGAGNSPRPDSPIDDAKISGAVLARRLPGRSGTRKSSDVSASASPNRATSASSWFRKSSVFRYVSNVG